MCKALFFLTVKLPKFRSLSGAAPSGNLITYVYYEHAHARMCVYTCTFTRQQKAFFPALPPPNGKVAGVKTMHLHINNYVYNYYIHVMM